MWSNRFKLENGRVGIVAIGFNVLKIQKSKISVFGDNKKVFNAELWDIYLAL